MSTITEGLRMQLYYYIRDGETAYAEWIARGKPASEPAAEKTT